MVLNAALRSRSIRQVTSLFWRAFKISVLTLSNAVFVEWLAMYADCSISTFPVDSTYLRSFPCMTLSIVFDEKVRLETGWKLGNCISMSTFLISGLSIASFRLSGTHPCYIDALTIFALLGAMTPRCCLIKSVGNGCKSQYFDGDSLMT